MTLRPFHHTANTRAHLTSCVGVATPPNHSHTHLTLFLWLHPAAMASLLTLCHAHRSTWQCSIQKSHVEGTRPPHSHHTIAVEAQALYATSKRKQQNPFNCTHAWGHGLIVFIFKLKVLTTLPKKVHACFVYRSFTYKTEAQKIIWELASE